LSLTNLSIDYGQDTTWYPDSGASAHMTPYDGTTAIVVGNGAKLPIKNISNCVLRTPLK